MVLAAIDYIENTFLKNGFFRITELKKRILQFVRITLLHFILLTVFATQNDMEINHLTP